jgi:hypothetical protein
MRNDMSNKQSTAMTKTEAAEHTLANLETQRRTLIQRGQEMPRSASGLAFLH